MGMSVDLPCSSSTLGEGGLLEVPGAMVGEQTAMASSRQIRGRGVRGGPREGAWSRGRGRVARGVEEEEGGVAASRRIEEGGVTRGWVADWPWGASVMRS
jgi:hypothetical protein